jgi:hypothetical protein
MVVVVCSLAATKSCVATTQVALEDVLNLAAIITEEVLGEGDLGAFM